MSSRSHVLISDFCFGETSPRVSSRVEGGNIFGISPAEVNRSGCKEITNMIVPPQGGAARREGFKFGRDTTSDHSDASAGASYRTFTLKGENADQILLIVPGEVWLYQLPDYSVVGHATTPYSANELANIGVTQFGKKAVIHSVGHRPRQLTTAPFSFVDPLTDGFIAPKYAFQDAKSPLPSLSKWRLRVTFLSGFAAQYMAIIISGRVISNSRGHQVFAAITTSTSATQASILSVLSVDPTYCYEPVVTFVATGSVGTSTFYDYDIQYKYQSKYGDGTGNLQVASLVQEQMQAVASPTTDPSSDLEPLWSGPFLLLHGGHYWQCTQTHLAIANTEPGVGVNAGLYWLDRGTTLPTEGDYDVQSTPDWLLDQSYSPRDRGWPGHMTFHEQRLAGSGPLDALSVIAATKIGGNNDMFNFTLGANANDGLLFRLTGLDNASVHWFHSSDKLYIGSSAGVFVQEASPWTPTNVHFPRINGFRCTQDVHAVEVEGDLFFPTVGAQQIRQISFSNDLQAWQSFDLTAFAEHLFTDSLKIKQLASHQGKASIVWAVRSDGALLGLTYSPSYNTLAWHKHSLSDPVVQVAPAYDGQKYVVVALVLRQVFAGVWTTRPCLETMQHTVQNLFQSSPDTFVEETGLTDWSLKVKQPIDWSVHMDSWEQIPLNLAQQIAAVKAEKLPPVPFELTCPARFALRYVGVIANGVYIGTFLANAAAHVVISGVPFGPLYVGFLFPSRIEPNRLEVKTREGTTQSQKLRWVNPVMRVLTSVMPLLNGFRSAEREQDTDYDDAVGLFTGDVKMSNLGSDGRIVIEADLPLPFHLTGLFGLVTTEEG